MTNPTQPEEAIFLAALQLATPEARIAYVQNACAGNENLERRLLELLASHDASSGPLDLAPPGMGYAATIDHPSCERPGTQIGPYKLLQQIGEGGMGTVYMAEQEQPVRRKVALKVIKPGMDSRQIIARFEAERQALALMDHVNIARVLDAGTTAQGRPYFVMELVNGVPITKYCDDNFLTPRQRLELFLPVCQAIQHAHQKGIIHRDIKPSNVMVTLYDGKPVPKVIDFGVAKATEQKLTERTLFTQYGTMVGTLEYMSPEQAEMSALGIDTRSDIYSLGVLLYELLTGSTPLTRQRIKDAAYAEVLRIIKEEEPPKPSTRLSDSKDSLPSVSAMRQTEPAKLTKLVRGELDWIVMKSLEKDRNRRYETANGFAADVQRYLNDEAVLACPPSVGYRLRKVLRRNRGPAIAAGLFIATLIAGVTGTSIGLIRAEQARLAETEQRQLAERNEQTATAAKTAETRAKQAAQAREAEALAILSFVRTRVFSAASPEGQQGGLGRDVTLRRAVEEALPLIATSFPNQPRAEAGLRTTIGAALSNLGDNEKAAAQFEKARALYERTLGPHHRETLSLTYNLASCYRDLGRNREAMELYETSLPLQRAHLGVDDFLTLQTASGLARTYEIANRIPEAIALGEECLALARARYGQNSRVTILAMSALASNYQAKDRDEEALKLRIDTLAASKTVFGQTDRATLTAMNNLANSLWGLNRTTEAIAQYEEALAIQEAKFGPEHPDTLLTLGNLAGCYGNVGRHADGERVARRVFEARTKQLGPNNPNTLSDAARLADRWNWLGRHKEALALAQKTLEQQKANPDVGPRAQCYSMYVVANSLQKLDRGAESLKVIEEYLDCPADHAAEPTLMKAMFETVLRIVRKNRDVDSVRAAAPLAERLVNDNANDMYNTACLRGILALLIFQDPKTKGDGAAKLAKEDADKAMVWLTRAVAAGWDDFAHMNTDPDLVMLREREDFQKLVTGERARAFYTRLLKELRPSLGTHSRRKQICLIIASSDELFQHFLDANPNDPQLWIARGRHFIRQGDIVEATKAYGKVIDRHPIDDECFEYACLLATVGQKTELNEFLARTAARRQDIHGPFQKYVLTRATSVVSQDAIPTSEPVAWGQEAFTIEPKAWFAHALALAHYRNGQYQEAIARAQESEKLGWYPGGNSATALVRAMAQQRLGQAKEAGESLAEGRKMFEPYPSPTQSGFHLTEWLGGRLLLDEARELIESKSPDPEQPATPDKTSAPEASRITEKK